MSYAQLAIMAAVEIINLFTAPATTGGAQLNSLKVSASTFGKSIPIGVGTQRIPGNIIWSLPLKQYTHNGKGLGQSAYTYNWTGAVAIGEGPIDDVLQIYADTKIVFDKTGQYGADFCHQNSGTYPNPIRFTVYKGTETQMPDPNLIALVGEEFATAHRGMAYVVFENIPITNYGNRVPNFNFVVAYSGNAQAFTVRNFDIEQLGVPADPAHQMAFQLWTKNRVYFLVQTPERGVTYCDIVSGETTGSNTLTNMFLGFPNGDISVLSFFIPGLDNYLYCIGNAGYPYAAFMKIDQDALVCVGEYDYNSGGQDVVNAIPLQINGTNFLVFQTLNRFISVFCTDTMSVIAPVGSIITIAPDNDNEFIGPGSLAQDTDGNPYGYLFKLGMSNTTTNPVNVYVLDVDMFGVIGQTLVGSFNPSDVNPAWSHLNEISGIAFDQSDGNLIFGVQNSIDTIPPGVSEYYIIKVSATSGQVLWAAPTNWIPDPGTLGNAQNFTLNAITDAEYVFLGTSGDSYNGAGDHSPSGYRAMYNIDTTDGSYVRKDWPINTTSFEAQTYDGNHGSLLAFDNLNPNFPTGQWLLFYADMAAAAAVPVSSAIDLICGKVGLLTGDLDTTMLDSAGLTVEGYIIGDAKPAAEAIKPLMLAFQFDAVETDGVLRFVPRGQSSALTVPSTDLAIIDNKTNALSQETRVQEVDIPRVITVSFFDSTRDYQASYQYSQRSANPVPTMHSNNRRSESVEIVSNPNAMKQLADKLLYSSWAERTTYKTRLPWQYLVLDPTDVITLTLSDDTTVVVRVRSGDVGANLAYEVVSVSQTAQAYTSNSQTDGGTGYPQNTQETSFATRLFLLDCPLLRDIDDTGFSKTLLYWAGGAYTSQWPGVELWESRDGTAYTDEDGVTTSAAWGVVTVAPGDTSHPFRTDHTNTLTVGMTEGGDELADITYLQMMNGANAAALFNQQTGIVEIIQFQNVVQNADGTFTLSTLLRGRRGTEVFTGAHVTGEFFILLTTNAGAVSGGVNFIDMALSDLNDQLYYKGVPNGTLLANTQQTNFTDTGRTMLPYAPVHLQAATAGSDIDLTWCRRTRVHGELEDGTGIVPLSEQDEHYSVEIYDALGTTLLRTIDVDYHSTTPVATPGVTYTNAEYTADFGSAPSSINMKVYQIGTIGRGFSKMYNVVVDGPPTP